MIRHYGKNIKLDGNGKYKVVFTIYPPSYNKNAPFSAILIKKRVLHHGLNLLMFHENLIMPVSGEREAIKHYINKEEGDLLLFFIYQINIEAK